MLSRNISRANKRQEILDELERTVLNFKSDYSPIQKLQAEGVAILKSGRLDSNILSRINESGRQLRHWKKSYQRNSKEDMYTWVNNINEKARTKIDY